MTTTACLRLPLPMLPWPLPSRDLRIGSVYLFQFKINVWFCSYSG